MFWLALTISGLAIALVKLGAYSVWLGIATTVLKFGLLILLVLAIAFTWKIYSDQLAAKRELSEGHGIK
jgi:hypothetical protein